MRGGITPVGLRLAGIFMRDDVQFLITHSGQFHADDVCAASILMRLHPYATCVRTRDLELIASMGSDTIIFDVGGVFDPEAGRFDHHMKNAAQRPDGSVYSSFGLIWKYCGAQYLESFGIPGPVRNEVHGRFDREFVYIIDQIDNGALSAAEIGPAANIGIANLIARMNPDSPAASDGRFNQATKMAGDAIECYVDSLAHEIALDLKITEEIDKQWGSPILILPQSADAHAMIDLKNAMHIQAIISPSSSGGFGMTVARREAGSYDNLFDFPEAWAGKAGQDLVDASGIADLTFCHRGRFFLAAKSYGALLSAVPYLTPARFPDARVEYPENCLMSP